MNISAVFEYALCCTVLSVCVCERERVLTLRLMCVTVFSERRVLNFRSQKSELLIFNLRVTVARYYFGSLFLFYFDRVCLLLQLLLIVYFWLDIV